jgi:hypothetical protein
VRVTVTQEASSLSVTPATVILGNTAGSTALAQAQGNLAWTASASQAWVGLTPASGPAGTTNILVRAVSANTGSATRSATVTLSTTVAGVPLTRTFAVQQMGVGFYLSAATSTLSLPTPGGSGSVAISSNVTWLATPQYTWLHVSPANASGNASILIQADANTGAGRSGKVTLTGAGVAPVEITVTQGSAATASITLQGATRAGPYSAGDYGVVIKGAVSGTGIAQRGVCWSLAVTEPSVDNGTVVVVSGGPTGTFSSLIRGFAKGTTCYLRLYVRMTDGQVFYSLPAAVKMPAL